MSSRQIAFLAIALFLAASPARAQAAPKPDAPEFDVNEHYTKYEVRIPMRDGVRLFTAVYVPKDSSRPYPFLINRTPYSISPYGVDQYRAQLVGEPCEMRDFLDLLRGERHHVRANDASTCCARPR